MKIDKSKPLEWWVMDYSKSYCSGLILLPGGSFIRIYTAKGCRFKNHKWCVKAIKSTAAALGLTLKKEPIT